jgi:hypothetical protein
MVRLVDGSMGRLLDGSADGSVGRLIGRIRDCLLRRLVAGYLARSGERSGHDASAEGACGCSGERAAGQYWDVHGMTFASMVGRFREMGCRLAGVDRSRADMAGAERI